MPPFRGTQHPDHPDRRLSISCQQYAAVRKCLQLYFPKTLALPHSSLIVKRQGLDNLEVLMLEVNPLAPKQREPIIHVLENWFKTMGVEKFLAVETDLPSNDPNNHQEFS